MSVSGIDFNGTENDRASSTIGLVSGPTHREYMVCELRNHIGVPKGVWYGDPLSSTFSVLLFQITIIFFGGRLLFFLMKPLRQSLINSYVMVGMILGPPVFGRNKEFLAKIFPPRGIVILLTLSQFGFMIHLFTLGLKINSSILRHPGRRPIFVGCACFLLPYVFGSLSFLFVKSLFDVDRSVEYSIPFVVLTNSISTFPVITSLLNDLQILNSDLGHFASRVSMVCDTWGWISNVLGNAVVLAFRSSSIWGTMGSVFLAIIFLFVVAFIFRPVLMWSASYKAESNTEEVHFITLAVILLTCGLLSEVLGQHAPLGAFFMGMALPDGPPLGATVVQKLAFISEGWLVPAFLASSGLRMHSTDIGGKSAVFTELVILMGYIGKISGTLGSAILCGVSFADALPLSLIMCYKGTIEISLYMLWYDKKVISRQAYSQLLFTMLIFTTLIRPIIAHLYDPSRKYDAFGRRTLQQSNDDVKVNVLVCLHSEDNVRTLMKFLEASNPTPQSPISIFVLQLQELQGRSVAMFIPHHQYLSKSASNFASSNHIVNAFNQFEQDNSGSVMVQHYTAIAPYATMHNDICSLALDRRIHFVIVPFHKMNAIDGTLGFTNYSIRNVNKNVMNKAPCTVGVLIDRGSPVSGRQSASYRVALLFFGGADDREALSFSTRIADHPDVHLTLIRVRAMEYENTEETDLDEESMSAFWASVGSKRRVNYIEERVVDGVGTTQMIRHLDGTVDLLMVGKYHDPASPTVFGLTEWNEFPELGAIGDMLATSDFQFSVLVVQQEPWATELQNYGMDISLNSSSELSRSSRSYGCRGSPTKNVEQVNRF